MGVVLGRRQVDLLRRHFEHVVEKNRVLNLTRVTDPEEAVRKLYLGSLALLPVLSDLGVAVEGLFHYLDLGTGAGFPGIPLAVACPHLEVLLLEARRKKVRFLEEVLAGLGLDRVRARHARGSDLPGLDPATRQAFELVTARAVAPAAEIVAESHELLVRGGFLVAYKGERLTPEEIREGEGEAHRHGMEFLGCFEQRVEDLRPRLLVYRRGTAADAGDAEY